MKLLVFCLVAALFLVAIVSAASPVPKEHLEDIQRMEKYLALMKQETLPAHKRNVVVKTTSDEEEAVQSAVDFIGAPLSFAQERQERSTSLKAKLQEKRDIHQNNKEQNKQERDSSLASRLEMVKSLVKSAKATRSL